MPQSRVGDNPRDETISRKERAELEALTAKLRRNGLSEQSLSAGEWSRYQELIQKWH